MRNRSSLRRVVGVLALSATLACTAANPAPPAFRRTIKQAQKTPYGAWVKVRTTTGNRLHGELLAIDDRNMTIGADSDLYRIPLNTVAKVKVSAYTAENGGIIAWEVVGVLSTVSHGVFLIFSVPTWMITGGVSARIQSRKGFKTYDRDRDYAKTFWALRKYARYPEGMPPEASRPRQTAPPPAPQGNEGQRCFRNATCNRGLVCNGETRKCVIAPTLGNAGGRCYANGSCNGGLQCVSGLCAAPAPAPAPAPTNPAPVPPATDPPAPAPPPSGAPGAGSLP